MTLNLFLKDIYSEKKIVKDKVVPEDFIYALSGYMAECEGVIPLKGIYSHISEIDLVKGKDGEWLEGSEEVYSYLLCMISPQNGEYEPGLPEFGFLYPAFRDRTGNDSYINIFETKPGKYRKLIQWMLAF